MLTGKQRHHLRALAHHKDPIVQIGKEGLSQSVVAQVDGALAAHELIKVRLGGECPIGRDEVALALAAALRADVAQAIGHIIVLFRRRPKKPKVPLTKRAEKSKPAKRGRRRKGGGKARGPESRRYERKRPGPRNDSRKPPRPQRSRG